MSHISHVIPGIRPRCIDLFCGIGGFRQVADSLGWETVFSSDINPAAAKAYEANYGERPHGDITKIAVEDIPAHDILLGGFPCQPFSQAGLRKGFDDTRGTLFFDVARILAHHRPSAFILENVAQLATHDAGRTLAVIKEVLGGLGYEVDHRILNALDFGLPHSRRRIFIVGHLPGGKFIVDPLWPSPGVVPMLPLEDILEHDLDVPAKHFATDAIRLKRLASREGKDMPEGRTIWHENKAGNVSAHPFSCCLRAGASYNYLLVDGIRRLTPRETLRLQGFPDTFKIVVGDVETRRQSGNSVAVPVVRAVAGRLRFQPDASQGYGAGTAVPVLSTIVPAAGEAIGTTST